MRKLPIPPPLTWPLALLLVTALLGGVAFLIAPPVATAQGDDPPPPGSPPPVPPSPVDDGVIGTQGLSAPPRPIFNSVTATTSTSVTVTFWPQKGISVYTVSYRRNFTQLRFSNKSAPVTSSGLTTVVVTGLQCDVEYEFWGWSFGDGTNTARSFNDRPAAGPRLATPPCDPTATPTPVPPTPVPPPPDRAGTVTLSDTTPQVGARVTASLTDPDGGVTNVSWQWQRLVGSWRAIAGATSGSYTPTAGDVGRRLRAVASYDDNHGTGKRATSAQTAAVEALPSPDAPTDVEATATGPTTVDLTWDTQSGVARHEVQRREGATGSFDSLASDIQGTSYTVTGLKPSTVYYFTVRAFGDGTTFTAAWGPYSLLSRSTTLLPTPTGLAADNIRGGRGISLKWQAAAGAGGYEVETSFSGGNTIAPISGVTAEATRLTPGARYSFRVRAWKQHGTSLLYSLWSNAVGLDAPTPTNAGHQEDHTVEYKVGSITAAPGLPSGVPDPAAIFPDAINEAVTAWNTAAAMISGKNLRACRVGACGGSNHDGGTVTVRTVNDPSNMDAGGGDHDPNHGCGVTVACLKLGIPSSSVPSTDGPGDHLRDMWMVFEEPAWWCMAADPQTGACTRQVRVYWTHVESDDLKEVPGTPNSYYHYIDPIMAHEFGHTFGLPDFGTDPTLREWPPTMPIKAIMFDPRKNKTPTAEDIAQLQAIYVTHNSVDH